MIRTFLNAAALLLALAVVAPAAAEMQPPPPDRKLPAPPPDIAEHLRRITVPEPSRDRGDRAQVNLLVDGFESDFPGAAWAIFRTSSSNVNAVWGKTTAFAASGSASVFCAGFGAQAVSPGVTPYPPNMASWMVSGPYNLSDATAAVLNFDYYLGAEEGWDFLSVIVTNDPTFTNYASLFDTGYTGNFVNETVNLANVNGFNFLGQSAVYIGFLFESDSEVGDFGALIDNVFLAKTTPDGTATATPTVTPSPTTASSPSPSATPSPTVGPTSTPTPTATPQPTPEGGILRQFTIFNDGAATLTVTGIDKQNNSSWLTVQIPGGLPLNIAAGGSATINVVASKNGLSTGNYTDRLLVRSNDADEPTYPTGVNVSMSVAGTPTPSLTPSPPPAAGVQDIVNRVLNRSTSGGADANSDGIFDAADAVRALP